MTETQNVLCEDLRCQPSGHQMLPSRHLHPEMFSTEGEGWREPPGGFPTLTGGRTAVGHDGTQREHFRVKEEGQTALTRGEGHQLSATFFSVQVAPPPFQAAPDGHQSQTRDSDLGPAGALRTR